MGCFARPARRLLALCLLLLASAAPVGLSHQRFAGDVRIATLSGNDGDAERSLEGYLTPASALDVEIWVLSNPGRALTLRLSGPGGASDAGLRVMAALASTGIATTAVATGRDCASACAIAWLGGATRIAPSGTTRLGFHSARCVATGCEETAVARVNAILDAALSRLEPTLRRALAQRDYLRDPRTMTYAASAGPTWVAWQGK